ncbi:hypothetical protein [Thomasclavelia cocleata]|uniref:hypothetical protein n=1 Tax=Thomasclavelia cocleata TaxID=69824 RepID=UPI00262D1735|nr:hypothetical protein [Thomasclavelia cocleata]
MRNLLKNIKSLIINYKKKYVLRPIERKHANLKEIDEEKYNETIKSEYMKVVFMHYFIPIVIIICLSFYAIIYWFKILFGF